MNGEDLCFTPAVELTSLIRRRALSPVEIMRAVLERIERLNGPLGAYVLVHAERALDEARRAEQAVMAGQPVGSLHGIPVSIKDNQWTAGDRTTFGSRLLATLGASSGGRGHLRRPDESAGRSEERRVGKECRSRWSPYH